MAWSIDFSEAMLLNSPVSMKKFTVFEIREHYIYLGHIEGVDHVVVRVVCVIPTK